MTTSSEIDDRNKVVSEQHSVHVTDPQNSSIDPNSLPSIQELDESLQRQEVIIRKHSCSLTNLEKATFDLNTRFEGMHNVLSALALDLQQIKIQTANPSTANNIQGLLAPNPQMTSSSNANPNMPLPNPRNSINPPRNPTTPFIQPPAFNLTTNQNNPNQENHHHNRHSPYPSLKLDFPSFKGDDMVNEWLNQVEQFFKFYQTEEHLWVEVASFYLKKDALKWFNWYTHNIQNYEAWHVFKEEIMVRFNTEEMERPYETLAKLKQHTTVSSYLSEFEGLQATIETLPPRFLLDRFIGGLKEEIQYDVLTSRPVDFRAAVSLAKMYESVWNHTKKGNEISPTFSSSENEDNATGIDDERGKLDFETEQDTNDGNILQLNTIIVEEKLAVPKIGNELYRKQFNCDELDGHAEIDEGESVEFVEPIEARLLSRKEAALRQRGAALKAASQNKDGRMLFSFEGVTNECSYKPPWPPPWLALDLEGKVVLEGERRCNNLNMIALVAGSKERAHHNAAVNGVHQYEEGSANGVHQSEDTNGVHQNKEGNTNGIRSAKGVQQNEESNAPIMLEGERNITIKEKT